jgi:formylglycine-generating enzyme required for sulfatase activity
MMTGFDTVIDIHTKDVVKSFNEWRRFSKDWYTIAPELRKDKPRPNPVVDIFALGILLKHLNREDTHLLSSFQLSKPNDPWACLAFHCLAEDPDLRFQSIDHFLRILKLWVVPQKPFSQYAVEVPKGKATIFNGYEYREVTVPKFWMAKYPVTNFEYEQFCQETGHPLPQHHKNYRGLHTRLNGPWCPVVNVNLEDAERYCRWLSDKTGERWRLPTEAEWIRAAVLDRALNEENGSNSLFPWGETTPDFSEPDPKTRVRHRANYENHYGGPTVVGAFEKGCSETGCYDMGGNVWEWCSDYLSPKSPLRVLKGGSFDFEAKDMQVIKRRGVVMTYRSHHVGFRVVKEG